MRFVVTGGGTAGHIYPALALVQALLADGHDVAFAGTPSGLEARLIPQGDERIIYKAFNAHGFVRQKPWTLLSSTIGIARSSAKARKWLQDFKPAAVAGFGGYVSIPVGLAAKKLHIPLLVHEQNSTAGMANRYLAQRANAVALTYQLDLAQKLGERQRITGNPVRSQLLKFCKPDARVQARRQFRSELGIPDEALVLLVFGGSQGARHINEAICALAPKLLENPSLHIVHITGPKQLDAVQAMLPSSSASNPADGQSLSARHHLIGYCEQMGEAFCAADCLLSRSGATSLAEITALGLPSLLVPYPYATDDHQRTNAQTLVSASAALMVLDSELDTPSFAAKLDSLLTDSAMRTAMAAEAARLGKNDAASELKKLLYEIANDEVQP